MDATTKAYDRSMTVAQLAIEHPGALSVFTRYKIDYCCGGNRSLKEACSRLGLNPEKIEQEIMHTNPENFSTRLRFQEWNSALVIDYIIQNHHTYVKRAIPEIQALLEKVDEAHGKDHSELAGIRNNFDKLANELLDHMSKEEYVLFPAIKRLESDGKVVHPLSITIQAPILAMKHEHESAGALIKSIRNQSNNYTVPEFACPTFTIAFQKLQEFDDDLMRHIHIENNILFERVREWRGALAGMRS